MLIRFFFALLICFSGCETKPVPITSTLVATTNPTQEKTKPKEDLIYLEEFARRVQSPQPILVILHGYGDNERGIFPLGKSIDERFYVVSVRAPIDLGNDRFAWFKLKGESSQTEVEEQAERIINLIQDLPRSPFDQGSGSDHITRAPVFISGFSQGARMAIEVAKLSQSKNKDLIQGVIAFSPATFLGTPLTIPTWVSHGRQDDRVPFSRVEKESKKLSKGDNLVNFVSFEGEHNIPSSVRVRAQTWAAKKLDTP